MPYYKPTVEHLVGECLKVVPLLTVSEAEQAKRELTEREEWGQESKEPKLEVVLQKEMNIEYRVMIAALEEQMRGFLLGQALAAAKPVL